MTPMQTAERDIEELRQSIRRMFSNLLSLGLEAHDRAAMSLAGTEFKQGREAQFPFYIPPI